MFTATCPRHLVLAGRGLNHAGAGRAPGSHAYVNPGTGDVVEVFFAETVSVGNAYALCRVANNSAMPAVRVDSVLLNGNGPLKLGQIVMIAVGFDVAGPRAKAVWPVETKSVAKPTTVEKLGRISAVKPGYGFIRPSDGSPDAFFHFSELRNITPAIGLTVRFNPSANARGPEATNVRPA